MKSTQKKSAKKPAKPDSASSSLQLAAVPWNGWVGVVFVVLAFFLAEVLGGLVIGLYAGLHHWTQNYAANWLSDSIGAQFVYVVIAEGLALSSLYLFMRHYRFSFSKLGLNKFRLRYLWYGLLAIPVYYLLAILALALARAFAPGINFKDTQQVGFTGAHGVFDLILTFISLVVLPPLAEEIMVRGFLYSSFKKVLPRAVSVILTSGVFAAAHLGEGSAGLLWTAAVQFFVLSLVLIYLREKTQSLWSSIILHGANNAVAFVSLFLIR